jgi:hypothetical protein
MRTRSNGLAFIVPKVHPARYLVHKDASIAINAVLDFLRSQNGEARCIHRLLRQCPIPYESAPFEIELEHPERIVAAELNITSGTLSRALAGFGANNLFAHRGKRSLSSTREGLKPLCASSSAKH